MPPYVPLPMIGNANVPVLKLLIGSSRFNLESFARYSESIISSSSGIITAAMMYRITPEPPASDSAAHIRRMIVGSIPISSPIPPQTPVSSLFVLDFTHLTFFISFIVFTSLNTNIKGIHFIWRPSNKGSHPSAFPPYHTISWKAFHPAVTDPAP